MPYTLRLIIHSSGGERVYERVFDGWDELATAKDELKRRLRPRWDPDGRAWRLEAPVDPDAFASAVAEVFGADPDEARRAAEEHNAALARLAEEAERRALEEARRSVSGTLDVAVPAGRRLSDEAFSFLRSRMEWDSRQRIFRFNAERFLRAALRAGTRLPGDGEEALRMVEEFLTRVEGLAGGDAVLDAGEWRRRAPDELFDAARRLGRVEAELVEAEDRRGKKRSWVRLVFGDDSYMGRVWELLQGLRAVPYNVEVFEAGERQLKTVHIRTVRGGESRNVIYVAPFLLAEVERRLAGLGLRVDKSKLPLGKRVLGFEPRDVAAMLRPYQREALEAWLAAGGRGAVELPTGAGKTWIGLAAIARLKAPTVVFVPTINLALQWRDKLVEVLGAPGDAVGILGGGYDGLGKPLLVALYDSGVRHRDEIARLYSLYIYDEGHHVAANTFKEIAWSSLAPHRLVLSATIARDDGNEELIHAMAGPIVYRASYYDLARQGYVSPVLVDIVPVPLPEPEAEKYRELAARLGEVKAELYRLARRYEAEAYRTGYGSVTEYLRATKNPEYRRLNREALSLRQRMRVMEQRNSAKLDVAARLAGEELGRGGHVFVFTNLEGQARRLYEELAARHGGLVALVTGKTGPAERDRIFRDFREGRVRCIVTTTVLDEGVDAPAADAAIVVSSRAIRHPRQFVQRIGRIVRPGAGKVAHVYILRTTGVGGVEERTTQALMEALDDVYNLEEMARLAAERRRAAAAAQR